MLEIPVVVSGLTSEWNYEKLIHELKETDIFIMQNII